MEICSSKASSRNFGTVQTLQKSTTCKVHYLVLALGFISILGGGFLICYNGLHPIHFTIGGAIFAGAGLILTILGSFMVDSQPHVKVKKVALKGNDVPTNVKKAVIKGTDAPVNVKGATVDETDSPRRVSFSEGPVEVVPPMTLPRRAAATVPPSSTPVSHVPPPSSRLVFPDKPNASEVAPAASPSATASSSATPAALAPAPNSPLAAGAAPKPSPISDEWIAEAKYCPELITLFPNLKKDPEKAALLFKVASENRLKDAAAFLGVLNENNRLKFLSNLSLAFLNSLMRANPKSRYLLEMRLAWLEHCTPDERASYLNGCSQKDFRKLISYLRENPERAAKLFYASNRQRLDDATAFLGELKRTDRLKFLSNLSKDFLNSLRGANPESEYVPEMRLVWLDHLTPRERFDFLDKYPKELLKKLIDIATDSKHLEHLKVMFRVLPEPGDLLNNDRKGKKVLADYALHIIRKALFAKRDSDVKRLLNHPKVLAEALIEEASNNVTLAAKKVIKYLDHESKAEFLSVFQTKAPAVHALLIK